MARTSFYQRVLLVDLLSIFFGISCWISINGLWVETPLLVQQLPEAWNLASYIVVIIQLANIGPILYSFLKFKFTLKAIEKPAIHITLFIGTLASLLLIFFWSKTIFINGSQHSIPLFILVGFLAIVDCTTSVLYLPFMSHLKSKYLMSFLIGEGFSGLIPSIVSLIQGIGGNPECRNVTIIQNKTTTTNLQPVYPQPRFSVEVFFIFLLLILCSSWISFILLNTLRVAKKEQITDDELRKFDGKLKNETAELRRSSLEKSNELELQNSQGTYKTFKTSQNIKLQDSRETSQTSQISQTSTTITTVAKTLDSETKLFSNKSKNISKRMLIILLLIQAYVCSMTNGILPSIQSYSTLPYGNLAYHLSVNLATMSNPIACFLAFYINHQYIYKRVMPILIIFGTLSAGYIILTAVNSPKPYLVHTIIGKWLIIFVWICLTSCFSFTKAWIADILRNTSSGHKALFLCGVFTQIGSALGAILMFILVNFTKIFVPFYPCV